MIELKDLRKTYRMGQETVTALDGVSLTIEQGELIAIMGPSGSGKSTLMHVIGLLDAPDSGSYRLYGREASAQSDDELALLRRRTIGFVFQQFHLLGRTSALENVALPHLYSRRRRDFAKAERHLKEVGLGSRLGHMPRELSGGQQQRVAIARALMNDTKILLADEPTGNLDSKSADEILELLEGLNRKGITVILVTHEESVAAHAHRVIRMRDGKIQSDERTAPTARAAAAPVAEPPAPAEEATALGAAVTHFHEGMRALFANKVRSVLSLLGILIGVAAVIAMLALGRGAREAVQKQLARMGSNRLEFSPGMTKVAGVAQGAGGGSRLTVEDAETIRRQFSEVTRVAPEVDGRGQVSFANKNWSTKIRATTPDHAPMHDLVPLIGRYFDEDEDAKRARVVVIGWTVAEQLFGDQSPLGELIKINKINFQVVGILPERGDNNGNDRDDVVHVPLLTGMHRLLNKDYVDEINMEIADSSQLAPMENKLKDLMILRHRVPASQSEPFRVRNLADIQKAMASSNDTMTFLIAVVAFISLLVGGIGIMNIMLVSVTERTKEIGLRKAIGARSADILSQFLVEALVISATGGALGILLGSAASLVLSRLAGWPSSLSLDAVLLATGSSGAIGVIFGLWPARKASRLRPIEALRHE